MRWGLGYPPVTPLFSDLPIRATKPRCLYYSKLNNSVPTIIRFYSSHWSCAGLSPLGAAASPIGLSKRAECHNQASSRAPHRTPLAICPFFFLFIIPIVVAVAVAVSLSQSQSQCRHSRFPRANLTFTFPIPSILYPFAHLPIHHRWSHSSLLATLSTTGSWLSGLFSPFCQHLLSPSPSLLPPRAILLPSLPPSLLILSFLPCHLDRLFSATSCITHRLHQSRPPSPGPSHTRYTCKAPPGVTPHILTSINNVLPDVFRSPEGLDWSRGTLQTFLPLPRVFQHYLYCFFPGHTIHDPHLETELGCVPAVNCVFQQS